jgi:hypothetical protein
MKKGIYSGYSFILKKTDTDHLRLKATCSFRFCRLIIFLLLPFQSLPVVLAQDSLLYNPIIIPDTVCTLQSAMKLIENRTGLSFSYNTGLINRRQVVSAGANNEMLISLLKRIFANPSLQYSIIGRHIVVYEPFKTPSVNPYSNSDSVLFFEIRGQVLDKNDRKPISFASVYLRGKSIGIIANENGQFQLKLNSSNLSDVLSISCIGYQTYSSPVSSLVNTTRNYLLIPDIIPIQEVIIRKLNPVSLLQAAVENKNKNYSQSPVILTSFYRESVKKGNHYMVVSEAVLENYKAGYNTFAGSDRVRILKGRKNEDISREDSILLKMKAGLNTMLLLDVVKNMPDFLTGKNIQDYEYRISDIVVDNGRDNYAIDFNPREGAFETYYSGRILIDIEDLAFKWVEFYIDEEKLRDATNLFIVKKPPHLKVRVIEAKYKVAFRKTGDRYYLSLVQCQTVLRIRNRNQLTGSAYSTNLEMAVTDIDTVHTERFSLRESARLNEYFAEQIGTYDESFWGEYNFITPDEPLENALIKLSKTQAARKDDK